MANKTRDFPETDSYGFYSKILGKPFDTLEELKAAEAAVLKAKKDEEDAKAAKKAELATINKAASAYLKLVEDNRVIRSGLKAKEEEAYAAYKAELDKFAEKHGGYHLTYKVDGTNVEFEIEENHTQSIAEYMADRQKEFQKFFNSFWF